MVHIWKHEGWWSEGATDAHVANLDDFIEVPFYVFSPVGDRFPKNTVVEIQSKDPPTDYFDSGLKFFASDRLKDILVGRWGAG
jgi:hypothetical protein